MKVDVGGWQIVVVLLALATNVDSVHGQVECPDSYWHHSGSKVIPVENINDGYCDCPLTGADEPNTPACSGSLNWNGFQSQGPKRFVCYDADCEIGCGSILLTRESSLVHVWETFHRSGIYSCSPVVFTCPQQPKLKLPMSRLHDGVCDCCEGADETVGTCADNCETILAEERRLRQQLQTKFTKGSQLRQKAVTDFAQLRAEKLEEAAQTELELGQVEESLTKLKEQYGAMEFQWIQDRVNNIATRLNAIAVTPTDGNNNNDNNSPTPQLSGMLQALSVHELIWWIVHACQLAGEMRTSSGSFVHESKTNKGKTCIPLRLAALDAKLWWEPKTYAMMTIDTAESWAQLAHLTLFNMRQPSSEWSWNPSRIPSVEKKSSRRRRLEDYEDYHDYHDDYLMDDDYHGMAEEEEYDDIDHEGYDRHYRNNRAEEEDDSSETKGDKREEIMTLLKSKTLTKPRTRFLERATALMEIMDKLMQQADQDDEDIEEEEAAATTDTESESSDDTPELQFDPMALPMTKNQLELRKDSIERGFDFAISAKVLLDGVVITHSFGASVQEQQENQQQLLQVLQQLALGVVNYGNLSSFHVWQLYKEVVAELAGESSTTESDPESCVAPWAAACPPTSTKRNVSSMSQHEIPPPQIVEEATTYCNTLMGQAAPNDSMCASTSSTDIPSELHDGYYGYYQVHARSEDDLMTRLFDGLSLQTDNSPEFAKLVELQDEITRVEDESKEMKAAMERAIESVGGKSEPETLGNDGELFHLKDQCFSYDAASYTYEICLFKKAKQRDAGSRSGGVHLGDWTGQRMEEIPREEEEEDDDASSAVPSFHRVWQWERGTKCWNGPERSVSATVTCGSETKVLSADEPETCRYVLEVESPIACDEDFRLRHNL